MTSVGPWDAFGAAVSDSVDWMWHEFAKNGEESAILFPLAKQAGAATWAAEGLSLSDDHICRKVGAMLAGFISVEPDSELLASMFIRERARFATDRLEANSVGEDIMFAATRWSESPTQETRTLGVRVLSCIVQDAINGVPWNDAHWAAANLIFADGLGNPAINALIEAPETSIDDRFLLALKRELSSGTGNLAQSYNTRPSPLCVLAETHPRYPMALRLWQAAANAQATLNS